MEKIQGKKVTGHQERIGFAYSVAVQIPSDAPTAVILSADGQAATVKENSPIGLGDTLLSKNDWIELHGPSGEVYRPSPNSEFALRPVHIAGEVGVVPVYYGGVMPISANGKYRTSCWIRKISSALIEAVDEQTDAYYALTESVLVYEFDESGGYFEIVTVNVGEKVLLRHSSAGPMRDRYTVLARERIGEEEADRIFADYLSPVRWAR